VNLASFKSPQLWISLIALGLSLYPFIRDLVKGTKIYINVQNQFQLYTDFGSVHVIIFLDIHNIGGQPINISRIDCVIERDSDHIFPLQARTYYMTEGRQALIGWIPLKKGEHWTNDVDCYDLFEEEDAEQANSFASRVMQIANEKKQATPNTHKNLKGVKEFFDSHFKLKRGNYKLFVAAISDSDEIVCVRGFDFTLFESNIDTLTSVKAGYEDGLFVPTSYIPVAPRLHPIEDDEKARSRYQKLIHTR